MITLNLSPAVPESSIREISRHYRRERVRIVEETILLVGSWTAFIAYVVMIVHGASRI